MGAVGRQEGGGYAESKRLRRIAIPRRDKALRGRPGPLCHGRKGWSELIEARLLIEDGLCLLEDRTRFFWRIADRREP